MYHYIFHIYMKAYTCMTNILIHTLPIATTEISSHGIFKIVLLKILFEIFL